MKCSECELYSKEKTRCIAGKVNPKTKRDTLLIQALFGNVCSLNKWFSIIVNSKEISSIK